MSADIPIIRLTLNIPMPNTSIPNAREFLQRLNVIIAGQSTLNYHMIPLSNKPMIYIPVFPYKRSDFTNDMEKLVRDRINTLKEFLSTYEFETNDVFVISPDQIFSINPTSIKDDVCFIWMDNTKANRINRYYAERRSYSFANRDDIEKKDSSSFVKLLYSFDKSRVLYFTDEDPNRVAAVIYSLIKHPDLMDVYTESFN